MYKNNNKAIMRQLAFRKIKTDGKSSFVTIIAIVLTAVMFTSLFTMANNIVDIIRQQDIRMAGGHAAIQYLDNQTFEDIKNHKLIKKMGYGTIISDNVLNEDLSSRTTEMWYMDKNMVEFKNIDLKGSLPEKENEMITDTKTLELLGVKSEIGEIVEITYNTQSGTVTREFVLSGYWESDPLLDIGQIAVSKAYTETFADELTYTYEENGSLIGTISAYFFFGNTWDMENKLTRILSDTGYVWEGTPADNNEENFVTASINPAYISALSLDDPGTAIFVIAACLLFMITGYLLIYNIFQISVIRDIQFLGQVKTLGTTKRQIKKFIRTQALLLSVVGIPVGLIIGYLFGSVLTPTVTTFITSLEDSSGGGSLNPIVFVGATVFVLITVLISTNKPTKTAARVSPILALTYTDGNSKNGEKEEKNTTGGGKIHRMALSNLSRNKKKTALTVLSMALALVVFHAVFQVAGSFDLDKYVSQNIKSDYVIAPSSLFNINASINSSTDSLPPEVIELLKTHNIFSAGGIMYATQLSDENDNFVEGFTTNASIQGYGTYTDGNPLLQIYGADDFILSKMEVLDGKIDYEKLRTGNYIIQGVWENGVLSSSHKVGDTITINYFNNINETYQEKEYTIMAQVKADNTNTEREQYGSVFYFPSEEYLSVVNNPLIMSFSFDVKNSTDKSMEDFVVALTESFENIEFQSKNVLKEELNSTSSAVVTIGGALTILIGLLGIVNFINSLVTSILARRNEFAMLQSIGMTAKQLRKMLYLEGLYYMAGTILLSLSISILVSMTIIKNLLNSFAWSSFEFNAFALFVSYPALIVFAVAVPYLAYKILMKQSVVERLRITY